MTILKILKFPDNSLKKKAIPITSLDAEIYTSIKNMVETMYYNNGLGLASIQVNIKQQILIINISNKNKQVLVIMNPKFINKMGMIKNKEGCLSFPNIFLEIKRHNLIKISFLSTDNKYKVIKTDKLLSICLQHEIDHLNGITLYDKISNIKKHIIIKKLK